MVARFLGMLRGPQLPTPPKSTELTDVAAKNAEPHLTITGRTQSAFQNKKEGIPKTGIHVELKDVPKSPVIKINGKDFKITHIRHRENSNAEWKTINIADLSQADLDKVAQTCEKLFAEIHPSKRTNLEQVTFKFSREHLELSLKDRLLRFFGRKTPDANPMTLGSISTKAPGDKKETVHPFNLEEYQAPAQATIKRFLLEADKAALAIAAKAPANQGKSLTSLEKQKRLEKSATTDALIKEDLKKLQTQFDDVLKAPQDASKTETLKDSIAYFHRRYNNKDYPTEFKEVNEIPQLLSQLTSKRAFFPLKPQATTTSNVSRQPADGNCFFHAMQEGLNELHANSSASLKIAPSIQWPVNHNSLRATVVNYLTKAIAPREGKNEAEKQAETKIKQLIDDSLEDFIAAKKIDIRNQIASLEAASASPAADKGMIAQEASQLQKTLSELDALAKDKNRHQKYLTMISRDGTFASRTEMHAISQIFGVNIEIHQNILGQRREDLHPSVIYSENAKTIKLLYVNGNHFDRISE